MKQNKRKKLNIKKLIMLLAVIMVVIIIIAIIMVVKLSNKKQPLKEAPNTEIDYSLLNVEVDDGNINMEDTEYAKVTDGVKRNNSTKVKEEKNYEGLKIKDASIEASGGMSQFMAIIYNQTEKVREDEIIKIKFIDKSGNEIATVETQIPYLEPNSDAGLLATTDIDITNAYDYSIIE